MVGCEITVGLLLEFGEVFLRLVCVCVFVCVGGGAG